jgi:2-polyprenyl-6-methoxyphenol hydroxylase-like FAD-dependent oxidoreductase
MSPVGGVGINFAIEDAIAAANIPAGPLFGKTPLGEELLAQVQKHRNLVGARSILSPKPMI